jgi:hypothetical protein
MPATIKKQTVQDIGIYMESPEKSPDFKVFMFLASGVMEVTGDTPTELILGANPRKLIIVGFPKTEKETYVNDLIKVHYSTCSIIRLSKEECDALKRF